MPGIAIVPAPYISRPEAQAFVDDFVHAFDSPNEQPVVFNVWGHGGVGKSTLVRRMVEVCEGVALSVPNEKPISFGLTRNVGDPIALMKVLHDALDSQFSDPPLLGRAWGGKRDQEFGQRYTEYFDLVHQLKTQAPDGKGEPSQDQTKLVTQFTQQMIRVGGIAATLAGQPAVGGAIAAVDKEKVAGAMVGGASLMLSEADRIRDLVQSHQATKAKREQQELVLDPVGQLTEAFVKTLARWSKQRRIGLVLDTYEAAPPGIDEWLRSMLANTNLVKLRVRLLIAGRQDVRQQPGWAKVQQDYDLIRAYNVENFTPEQNDHYLGENDIPVSEAQRANIYRVTGGWPYYLNKIREKYQDQSGHGSPQNSSGLWIVSVGQLADFLLDHVPDAQRGSARQVVELVACCQQFDGSVLRAMLPQFKLDAAQGPEGRAWLDWLKQQSFVEFVEAEDYRLEDVARDIFRQSLHQSAPQRFERVHDLLARYFKGLSDYVVKPSSSPSKQYNNPDWRRLRGQYLYHLLFTSSAKVETELIAHVLAARYFRQDEVVQTPFSMLMTEINDWTPEPIRYATKEFCQELAPAVFWGWAMLEEVPIDYEYNLEHYNLSKAQIDKAIHRCLGQLEPLTGLAKFVALIYQSKRCPVSQTLDWLLQAQTHAEFIVHPDDPEFSSGLFLWDLGNSFYETEAYEEAIASYDKAIAIKQDSHEALSGRGVILAALGRREEAIDSFDKAIAIKSDYPDAWYNRGISLAGLDRREEAIDSYDKAIAIKPDYPAWTNRGNSLADLDRREEAIDSYDKAIAIKPDYPEAWNNRGNSLAGLDRREEAIESYDKALEINPEYASAMYNKACCFSLMGDTTSALPWLEKAITLDPENRDLAKTDDDFACLRDDEQFQQLIR